MTPTPAAAPPSAPIPSSVNDRARRLTLAGYGATVFVSFALLLVLVLEIVARRLVAPYIGRSLCTWISIIGVKAVVRTLAIECAHVDIWMEGVPEAARVTFVLTATNGLCLPKTVTCRTPGIG